MLCIGCGEEKEIKAKGLCNKCYMRFQRHGDTSWERKKKGATLCSYCYEKPVHAKDLCANCYRRYLANGSPERVKIKKEQICAYCGKMGFIKAKGFCNTCYNRAFKHGGDPTYIVKNIPAKIRECEFCGEVKEIVGKGLCKACYQRNLKKGTAEYAPKRVRHICKVRGCEKIVASNGLCSNHAAKMLNKRKSMHNTLIKRFRITVDNYEERYNEQGGVCAICGMPETIKANGSTINLAVDHCHKTDKVRGLLCSKCNVALGGFKDSIELLTKAIEYLKTNK